MLNLHITLYANAFKKSVELFYPVWRSSWKTFFAIFAIGLFFGEYFLTIRDLAGQSTNSMMQVSSSLGLFSAALLEGMLLQMVVAVRANEFRLNKELEPFWDILKRSALPLVSEGLRVLGQVLLWSLALLIPGIVRQVQLYFVPYTVLLDPNYDKGEVDALKRSREITKGMVFSLLLIIALLTALTLSLQASYQNKLLQDAPIKVAPLFIGFNMSIFTFLFLYEIYRARLSQDSHN